jgi:hypothetical protein
MRDRDRTGSERVGSRCAYVHRPRAKRGWGVVVCTALLVSVVACGGGGERLEPEPETPTAGGIGIGVITGFGSVILNDVRRLDTDADTVITIDGIEVGEADLRAHGLGLVTQVLVRASPNEDFTRATAARVDARHSLKGPVTATDPLQVLGQDVIVTGDTVLAGVPSAAVLQPGQLVEVSGYIARPGAVEATRLQVQPGGIAEWQLTGEVTALTVGGFLIGAQEVRLNGLVPRDCGAGLAAGDRVEVRAAPTIQEGALSTVLDVQCIPPAPQLPDLAARELAAFVEGFISHADDELIVGTQVVRLTPQTQLRGGSPQDLLMGRRIEVQGVLETGAAVLTARRITFRQPRVRIEAEVLQEDLVDGVLRVLTIPVRRTVLTEDHAEAFTGAGLPGQIQVRGFVDREGEVFATEVHRLGAPDPFDLRLGGPARDIVPFARFQVLGIEVDVPSVVFFQDRFGEAMTSDQFFAALEEGRQVQVHGGLLEHTLFRIGIRGAQLIELQD